MTKADVDIFMDSLQHPRKGEIEMVADEQDLKAKKADIVKLVGLWLDTTAD